MAIEDLSNVDPDMIMTLMREDQTFMYRLDIIKDKIRTNLDGYADSIEDAEFGMFTEDELDEMEVAKSSILNSWNKLEERLNVDFSDSFNFSPDDIDTDGNITSQETDSAAGVFEDKTPSFILESIGDNAMTQIANLLNDNLEIGDIDLSASGGAGVKKGIFGSIIGVVIANMGLKTPSWLTAIAKGAGAAAPVVLLAGGIIWAAMDGIGGFMKSGEWGVSKISGALGGIIGGLDSGLKGSMKGMGKWALTGAGIGSLVAPGVGTLLGGLIGGVFGAIAGWIGGERIATAFDKIGAWFTERWEELTVGFKDGIFEGVSYFLGNLNAKFWSTLIDIGDYLKQLFTKEGREKMMNSVSEFHAKLTDFIGEWLSDAWDKIKNWWKRGKKSFDEGQEAEIFKDMNREQEEILIDRASGKPTIELPERTKEEAQIQEAIALGNIITAENAKAQQKQWMETGAIQREQLEAMKKLIDKPVGGSGSASIKFDQGEIREATTDAAYNMRQQYYMRGR